MPAIAIVAASSAILLGSDFDVNYLAAPQVICCDEIDCHDCGKTIDSFSICCDCSESDVGVKSCITRHCAKNEESESGCPGDYEYTSPPFPVFIR